MASLSHEGLLSLFRDRPELAPQLLRDALHASLPPFNRVRVSDPNLADLAPAEFRADLVLLLEDSAGGAPTAAIIVEVQLGTDPGKQWSWPMYLTGLRARLRCDVSLLVVTDDASVASWASKPIETGHPGFALVPLVLGPLTVPIIRDEDEAARAPELAVLSALVHGQEPYAVEIGKAALLAARGLDEYRAALYTDLVLVAASNAARTILQALMATKTYQFQSDFAKAYVAQGRAEGEARGEARALLHVLKARGIEVPEAVRERITSCTDLAVLDGWLERASTASSVSDVVGE